MANPADLQGLVKVVFRTNDLDHVISRWQAQGDAPLVGPIEDSALGIRAVIIVDPDGVWIAVHERLRRSARHNRAITDKSVRVRQSPGFTRRSSDQ
jgi:hypothetical protein